MITKKDLTNILVQYPLESVGLIRHKYIKSLKPTLDRKEILILKGIRRCGKSTIMKQLIQHLISKGIKKEQILYVNLDDYNFLPYLDFGLLDLILEQVGHGPRAYIFLDEIQKITGFESWLRTQYDREVNVKFIISGSTSALLSKELGTLLTGRNLTFQIFPLDYKEFSEFSDKGFDEFMTYGGFPEVVLEERTENKLNLLRDYISDIINKDIIGRHKIKDAMQFRHFAQFLLNNPGIRISVNRLSKELDIGKDSVKNYLQYMIESYILFEVPFFSYSAKSKFIAANMPKYYPIDNGLYLVNTSRRERGKQVESAVAQKFFRQNKDLFYWKGKNEVDFVFENNAFNVVSSEEIPEREISGLSEIKNSFKHISRMIILNPKNKAEKGISYINIEEFLLEQQNTAVNRNV